MIKHDKVFLAALGLMAVFILAIASVRAFQPSAYIAGDSMKPTLFIKSRIQIQRNAYQNIAQVQRGDIIVHTRLDERTGHQTETVNRVIGLPGDKVQLSGTSLAINGRNVPHVLVRRVGKLVLYRETNGKSSYQILHGDNTSPAPAFSTTVSANHLLCLGDNRDNAYDSRYTGLVPFASIKGRWCLSANLSTNS